MLEQARSVARRWAPAPAAPGRGYPTRGSSTLLPLTGLLACWAPTGCAPRAELRLLQPNAPPAQRDLSLASDWAYYLDEGGRRFILLAFPLPGARDGPRDFLVYLSTPEGEGEFAVHTDDPAVARGFLIQVVGQLKGKTLFESGPVHVRHRPFDRARRELTLELRCADGTQLTGRAMIEPEPRELRAFQHRFAGDVQRLASPETQPGTTQPHDPPVETSERAKQPAAPP